MEARTDFIRLFPLQWDKCLHCSVEQLVFTPFDTLHFPSRNVWHILSDLLSISSHPVEWFHYNITALFFLNIRNVFKSVTV